jgi:hypothetical protein
MRKSPRSAAVDRPRERVVIIDTLKQQMLDLKALRKKVAEAESRTAALKRSNHTRGRLTTDLLKNPSLCGGHKE